MTALELARAERDEYRQHYRTMRAQWEETQRIMDRLERRVKRLEEKDAPLPLLALFGDEQQ